MSKGQDPRSYTVKIRHAEKGCIVGTGITVTADYVLTCAHVARDAGLHPGKQNTAALGVYFPQVHETDQKNRQGTICAYFERYEDDIVLLKLNTPAPIGPEQMAKIGHASAAAGHPFSSFGYRRIADYQGLPASGEIVGCCDKPENRTLLCDPVMLTSQHIDAGMSGAGVLDTEDNIIIGLIAETWDSLGYADRDTNFAIDTRILTFEPLSEFGIPIYEGPLEKTAAPIPPELPDPRMALLRPTEPAAWYGAPALLDEWVGREELLRALTGDWESDATRITALVGFGGEGKSSLARRWVEQITSQTSNVTRQKETTPDASRATHDGIRNQYAIRNTQYAIFWWSFYDEASVDAFAESLLKYLSGGRIDARVAPAAAAKLELCARLLQTGRVLLVLDGFEVMQHQGGEGPEGDLYGLIQSGELRRFLEYLAAPESAAFCLITSRAPLLDLLPYTTCTQRDVTRLNPADGRALLRELGVQGPDKALDAVVRDWDGHALTLGLLGSLLAERYGGDLARLNDLPLPTADETKYERVHRVLRRYDDHLTGAERDVLKRFSLFRAPVTRAAFEKLYRAAPDDETTRLPDHETTLLLPTSYSLLPDLDTILQRLIAYHILRHNPHNQTYTTHPLIRSHYFALFTHGEPDATRAAHERIKDYYLELAGDTPHFPTLDDLRPLIEMVHHACRAGAYDEAWDIYWQRVLQRNRFVLPNILGAWETEISTLHEFFPRAADGAPDLNAEPQVSAAKTRSWILNEVGLCLMNLGRLRDAVPFYERGNVIALSMDDWHNASVGYNNLADLHIFLGDLLSGAEAARESLALARQAENQRDERTSLAWLAWAEHLRGESESALAHFAEAEALEQKQHQGRKLLTRNPGIWYAELLIREGKLNIAHQVTEANLLFCKQYRWEFLISMCHRVLGDIAVQVGGTSEVPPTSHYDEALRIARTISKRNVLIEALLGRGRFLVAAISNRATAHTEGFDNLNEALGYALQGGYRIYEADIRVALARAYLAQGDPARAREQSLRARALSADMGYHWGVVDAEDVLARIS